MTSRNQVPGGWLFLSTLIKEAARAEALFPFGCWVTWCPRRCRCSVLPFWMEKSRRKGHFFHSPPFPAKKRLYIKSLLLLWLISIFYKDRKYPNSPKKTLSRNFTLNGSKKGSNPASAGLTTYTQSCKSLCSSRLRNSEKFKRFPVIVAAFCNVCSALCQPAPIWWVQRT